MSVTGDTDDEFELEEYESEEVISDIEEEDEEISEFDIGNDEKTFKDRMYMYVLNNLKSIKYKPSEYLKYNQDISIYQPSFIYNYAPVKEFAIINLINPERREEVTSQFNKAKSLFSKKDIKSIISSESNFNNIIVKSVNTLSSGIIIPSQEDILKFFS